MIELYSSPNEVFCNFLYFVNTNDRMWWLNIFIYLFIYLFATQSYAKNTSEYTCQRAAKSDVFSFTWPFV